MTKTPYSAPVDKLLTLGEPPKFGQKWPNYLKHGFGPEHVPDLVCVALDDDLNLADTDSREVWAPLHAWRTLGQLRAVEAIPALLKLLDRMEDYDDDWLGEELPTVFGLIGPATLPALTAYCAHKRHAESARTAAAAAMAQIAKHHPAARPECVAALTRQLEQGAKADITFNGYVVDCLVELHATEAAPVIERAFAAGGVDEYVGGDWEDVQISLGLKTKRTKAQTFEPRSELGRTIESFHQPPPPESRAPMRPVEPKADRDKPLTPAERAAIAAEFKAALPKPQRHRHKKK